MAKLNKPNSNSNKSVKSIQDRAKSKNLASLRLLIQFVAPYWKIVLAAGLALICAAIGTLSVGRIIQLLIDRGFSSNEEGLTEVFILAYVVVSIIALSTFARYYLVMWLGERVVADLRSAIYKKVIELSPAFFELNKTGEIISRLSTDTTLIQSLVGAGASVALRNILLLVGGLIMLIITSAKLSGLIILSVPIIVVPLILFGRKVRTLSRKTQDEIAKVTSAASESLHEVRTVQAFVREDYETLRFNEKVKSSFNAARKQIKARGWLTFAIIAIVFGSIVSVLWIGAVDVRSGSMSGGDLGAFVVYSIMTAGSVAALSEVYNELQRAAGASERLAELLNSESEIKISKTPFFINDKPSGFVQLDKVNFSYPVRPELNILEDFSLKVDAGEHLALVGPSGSGKTTILQLLLRFYDPSSGYISFEGVDLVRIDPKSLRSNIGIVSQDPVIFDLDAWDNIAYGKPDATREEIRGAAEMAKASEFLNRLPDGFSTPLGERGVTLSGGQKQRIAIARAILKDPALLLLDEATSSLDAENEELIQKSLEVLLKGRTSIVVAHRLSTVQKADRIVVIDKGNVVSQGTHNHLIREGGLYSRIAKLQFRSSELREMK